MRIARAIILIACLGLGSCAAPLIGALTVGEVSTIISAASTVATGKGLSEQALSMTTGKDCNVLGSITQPNRKLCEVWDSEASKGDFRGIFAKRETAPPPLPLPPPGHKPVLVIINGEPVYTMAPVVRAGDIASAKSVPGAPEDRAGSPPKPVLVRLHNELIYTMPPVMDANDIRSLMKPPELQPPSPP